MILVLAWTGAGRALPQGVRPIAAGGTGVRFAVEVPEPELRAVANAPGQELAIDGYEPGARGLPSRVVLVAVPPEGPVRVQGVALDETRRESVSLPADESVSGDGFAPSPARLLDVSWLRNQRIARVEIAPARYDPAARRLDVAGRIEVSVEVSGGAPAGMSAESPDPFEEVYRGALVNYEQARAWRRARSPGGRIEGADGDGATGSVIAGRNWIKIAVDRPGFQKVEYRQVRNLAPFAGQTVAVDSVRLFAWPGEPMLDEGDYCDGCDYEEVAIGFVDDGDGRFGSDDDALYFFGLGPSDWADVYDSARPDTDYINHPYERRSYYYLTVSESPDPLPGPRRRIALESGAVVVDGGEATPTTFTARLHAEADVEYVPSTVPQAGAVWEKWFWILLDIEDSFQAVFDAPGIEPGADARLRVGLWGLSARDTCFWSTNPPDHLVDLAVNGTAAGRFGWERLANGREPPFTLDTQVAGVGPAANNLRVTVPFVSPCFTRVDEVAVAWFEVFYPRRFEPSGGKLEFDAPPAPAGAIYSIGPFADPARPRVFDVTDPLRPVEITDLDYAAENTAYRLRFERAAAGPRRYRVLPDSAIVRVSSANVFPALSTSLVDLRSAALRADYLVIYYDEFKTAADSLALWREQHSGLETMVVPVSSLFDQFSGGRTDPAALRNFLRVTWTTWAKTPAFVTFLGDASFDFKNVLGLAAAGRPGALLPSYPNGFDFGTAFATDDWILNVDNAAVVLPDFFGGRLPAGDAKTALEMVLGKVLHYERGIPLETCRNRVMLIADDHEQGAADDILRWAHVRQTSVLDSTVTPPHMDRAYVYLHTYADGPGDTKPGAKADILSNLNGEGVAIFNYIGHGSPFKISDESVFQDADVGTLVNGDRLPLFVAASCDIGKYDDPGIPSLGERLLSRAGGGAVGVISATELARSGENAALNTYIYENLFARDAAGRYSVTVSEALLLGKLSFGSPGGVNSQKYQLLGDAALRLNLPEQWVDVTLWDSAGVAPLAAMEQGRTVTFRGSVREGLGGAAAPFEGVASLLIEDSAPLETTPDCRLFPGCGPSKYYFRAAPIYRGDVGVRGGAFEGRFVVPFEARTGARARLRAYLAGTSGARRLDGVGSVYAQLSPGTGATGDAEGPVIRLSFEGGALAVRPDATLRIDLFDPSGILTTGYSPQNAIVVTMDDNTTSRVDVTSSFRYAADSHQAGTARFRLPGLAVGAHRIKVSAADNLASGLSAGAHRSAATIDFEVAEVPPLRIRQSFLFPNPVRSGTGGTFVVDAPGDSVNVLLRIYTVSGRLIRTLRQFGGFGQIQIRWDGLDAEGQAPGAGLYIFKVHANVRDPGGASSPRQKAVAEGKFAVLGR